MSTRAERQNRVEFGRALLYEQVKCRPWREADALLERTAPKPTLPRVRCLEREE